MLSVYKYKDPIDYLSAFIELQKEEEENFSLRSWAKSIGLPTISPIIDVLKRKKKLKDKLLEKVISGLPIDKSEVMYFQAIVERSQAKSNEKIVMYDLLLNELSPNKVDESYTCLRNYDLDIFSHWIYMIIFSLTYVRDFELTSRNIVKALSHDLEIEFVENSLDILKEKNLLISNDKGQLVCRHTDHTTSNDVKYDNVETYYSLVCDLAKKSTNLPLPQREFQCFSYAMPQDQIAVAKEILRKCRVQLLALSDTDKNDGVFQANLMLFPMTDLSMGNEASINRS